MTAAIDGIQPLDWAPREGIPLHKQVYEVMRSAILGGHFRAGDQLPPSRKLAAGWGLSRATVAEAYEQLRTEGYVQSRQGSGVYVALAFVETGQTSVPLPVNPPAECRAPVRLSRWAHRITEDHFNALVRPPEPGTPAFDFRPHRVAADLFPWDAWRMAMERATSREHASLLRYPPAAGYPPLQQAIAAHVRAYRAVQCEPDQVMIVNGSLQGMNLLAQLVLDPGDVVAVEDPGYPTARMVFESHDVEVVQVPVDRDGLQVEQIPANVGLIHVTPSHQDPTGSTLSLSRRLELLRRAEHANALVMEDDYDSEFRYDGRPVESLHALDHTGRVLHAGTFSKTFLPGLRMGYMILPSSLVGPFAAAKSLRDGGSALLEQLALAEFIRSGEYERHIRKMRRIYRHRRDVLVECLDATFHDRVSIGGRHGGLNILVALDTPMREADILAQARAAGIGLQGAGAYFSKPPERPHLLLGFAGLDEAHIRGGVLLLAGIVS